MNEIRDPIHGFITLSDDELKIINTPLFQRLRKIKQLAMAYLVYPGANHTRFDHSLGVYHIASLMANKLLPEDKKRIVKFAALLHDIGHGPFSHVSEDILDRYSSNDKNTEKEKIHEMITMKLIENNKEIENLLSPEDRKSIVGILTGKKMDMTLMKEIVSGPLDADKLDYLLRDTYFCGVKYGVFDLDRVINTLTSCYDNYDTYIAVNYDGVNSLEQYVLAKYYMTRQVYRHKVRAVSDAMIERGLELGIEKDDIEFLKKLYVYEDTDKYLDNYLNYWDDKVISELIFSDKNGYAKDIFRRLYDRRLFKRVFSKKREFEKKEDTIVDESERVKMMDKINNITSKENEGLKKTLEEEISKLEELKCEKEYVIVNSFTIKSVKEMSRDSEGGMIIIERDKSKKQFEEISTVFKSINESMNDIYFEVYAPLEYKDLRDKDGKLKKLEEGISSILRNLEG